MDLMEKLQQQINNLKIKTLRLGRIASGGSQGLIDSGATKFRKLEVSLADGTTTRLPISPGGAMVTFKKDTEPIVPMHQLTGLLGCEVSWKGDQLEAVHPTRGKLPVQQVGGCPQVTKALAIELISEIEDRVQGIGTTKTDFAEEEEWMRRLVQEHPVLKKLPSWIKERLAVAPGKSGLDCRRIEE